MANIPGNGASLNVGALQAFVMGIQVAAYNIANFSTSPFTPLNCVEHDGPHGLGVRAVIRKNDGETGKNTGIPGVYTEIHDGGMDVAKEYASIIANHHNFDANAKAIGSEDEIMDSILNLSS